jgi:hypothetical protein
LGKYIFQLSISLLIFSAVYFGVQKLITFLPLNLVILLMQKMLFWFWVGPLIALVYLFMLRTRKYFGIKLYFLD